MISLGIFLLLFWCAPAAAAEENCLRQIDDSDILFLFDFSGSTNSNDSLLIKLVTFTESIMKKFDKANAIRYSFIYFPQWCIPTHYLWNPYRGKLVETCSETCILLSFKESENLSMKQTIKKLVDSTLDSGGKTFTREGFKAAELLLKTRSAQDRRSILIFVGDGDGWHDANRLRITEIVNHIKARNTTIFTARCSNKLRTIEEQNLHDWASSPNETFNCDKIIEGGFNDTASYSRLGELVAEQISKTICGPPIQEKELNHNKNLLIAGVIGGILAALFLLLVAFFWSRRRNVKLAKNEQVQVEPKVVDLSQGLGVSMSLEEEVFLPRVTPVKKDQKKLMKIVKVKKKTA